LIKRDKIIFSDSSLKIGSNNSQDFHAPDNVRSANILAQEILFQSNRDGKNGGMKLKTEKTIILERYSNALSGLPSCGLGKKAVSALFPHLKRNEVLAELLDGCGVIACPSVVMKNIVHLISYECSPDALKLFKTVMLSQATSDEQFKYAKRAADYAGVHWGARLIAPVSAVVAINLIDPEISGIGEKVNGSRILYIALNRDFEWIMYNTTRARHSAVEQSLIYQTVSSLEGRELMACGNLQDSCRMVYNCELCGAPLEKYHCAKCGHSFAHCPGCQGSVDQICFECDCEVLVAENIFSLGPLPKSLVSYLEKRGHVFPVDTDIARKKEWEYADAISARKMHDH
jgi:hypothetical protein